MTMTMRGLAAVLAAAVCAPAWACSSCGCTLTSDWIQEGLALPPGTRLDLRYDFIPQDSLQSGTRHLDSVPLPNAREIQRYTDNHYLTLGLDHAWNTDWGVNAQVPLVYRPHETVSPGDTEVSHSRYVGLGDVRATVRYQGFKWPGITGVTLGVKFASGGFHQVFDAGPSIGQPVDRGLQPGTGTTDLLVGSYHFGNLARRLSYFTQVQAQVPFGGRDHYRAGVAVLASAGVDYTGWRVTPELQLNFRYAGQDRGFNSDRDNSGGKLLYVSPGAVVRVTARVQVFAFVQVPIVQDVVGLQIVPRYTVSTGLRLHL